MKATLTGVAGSDGWPKLADSYNLKQKYLG